MRVDTFFLIGSKSLVYQFLLDVIEYDGSSCLSISGRDCEADSVGSSVTRATLPSSEKLFKIPMILFLLVFSLLDFIFYRLPAPCGITVRRSLPDSLT